MFNPPAGYVALYTNGVLSGINTAVTVPFTSVNDVTTYLARSLYSGDPYPDITFDEFRLYNGALSTAEVAATEALGPNALLATNAPAVTAAVTAGNLTLTWPLTAAGYTVLTSTNLTAGSWSAAPGKSLISGGQWVYVIPATNIPAQYFRLEK